MLHRLAGTIIFLMALIAIYLVAQEVATSRLVSGSKLIGGKSSLGPHGTFLIPVACYLAVTVAIPLLNGASRRHDPVLGEHLFLVVATSLLVVLPLIIINLFCRVKRKKRVDNLPQKNENT
jgi:hypothetical protein